MLRKIAAAYLAASAAFLLGPLSWAQQRTELPTGYNGVELDMPVGALKAKRRIVPVQMQGEQESGFEFYTDNSKAAFLGEDIQGWYGVYDGVVKAIQFTARSPSSSIENCVNALDRWVQPFAKKYGLFNAPALIWFSGHARVEAEKKYPDRRVTIYAMSQESACQKGIEYHISFIWHGRRLD
jgi:hypothetical protein